MIPIPMPVTILPIKRIERDVVEELMADPRNNELNPNSKDHLLPNFVQMKNDGMATTAAKQKIDER